VKSKWCNTLWRSTDTRWYVEWRRPCSERWGDAQVEWYGMVDGRIVYFFWHCPPDNLPELLCVEFDTGEGLKVLLRNLEKDRPSKVYYYGELPPELSKLPGLIPVAKDP
jgi:hypothetical protein